MFVLVAALLVSMSLLLGCGGGTPEPRTAPPGSPNIVVVMSDDQNYDELRSMPLVQSLMVKQGVRFSRNYVSYSACCPSRATFLSGRYAHNHDVRSNMFARHGGYGTWRDNGGEANSLPVWLDDAGYSTAHIGKYLNGYGFRPHSNPLEVPAGWSEWYGTSNGRSYQMYDYDIATKGPSDSEAHLVHYGNRASDYLTDVQTGLAAAYIRRHARARKPFFLSVAPLAPHNEVLADGTKLDDIHGPRPARRDIGAFKDRSQPRSPSFNEKDVSDKPGFIRKTPRLDRKQIDRFNRGWRQRRESLLSVDRMVAKVVGALRAAGELENTYVIFTSDNGYMLGEHRLAGKVLGYEESTRVPLLIRGPDLPRNLERRQLVGNVDLAPTIAELAGAKPRGSLKMDGTSLLPAAIQNRSYRRPLLIEALDYQPFNALRDGDLYYAEYPNGERELYDLSRDPYQLKSTASSPASRALVGRLHDELDRLKRCKADSCRAASTR